MQINAAPYTLRYSFHYTDHHQRCLHKEEIKKLLLNITEMNQHVVMLILMISEKFKASRRDVCARKKKRNEDRKSLFYCSIYDRSKIERFLGKGSLPMRALIRLFETSLCNENISNGD